MLVRLLTLSLAVALLAGCSGRPAVSGSSSPTPPPTTASATPAAKPTVASIGVNFVEMRQRNGRFEESWSLNSLGDIKLQGDPSRQRSGSITVEQTLRLREAILKLSQEAQQDPKSIPGPFAPDRPLEANQVQLAFEVDGQAAQLRLPADHKLALEVRKFWSDAFDQAGWPANLVKKVGPGRPHGHSPSPSASPSEEPTKSP